MITLSFVFTFQFCTLLRRALVLVFVFCTMSRGAAQDAVVPLGSLSQELLERMQIMGDTSVLFHSSIRPYRRGDVFSAALRANQTSGAQLLSEPDRNYLLAENDEFFGHSDSLRSDRPVSRRSFLGFLYTYPASLYAYDSKDFYLRINPVLHFGLGRESGRDGLLFVNRRGVELRGGIDQKVFLSTSIIEAQLRPPVYVREFVERYKALPDAGLFKDFDSRFLESEGAYDYLTSSGYLGFNVSRHVGIQFGHGKNFIGDGYRSLFLSDFAKNYFYLKLNTRVWRFHYQNIFTELGAREKLPGNVVVPKKYLAAHYLSFLINENISVGIFEAVMFARERNQFEFQYLNPVILYRSIEHHVGSPDNVLIGLSARWDIKNTFRLYGQFIVDEFSFGEVLSSRGWWGNKNGIQLGVKYPDAFHVAGLDLQAEYNRVRPFTYSHYDSLGSFSHFNQPLAHPVGANFTEILLNFKYRPATKAWLNTKFFLIRSGKDTEETYYGSDILRSNLERNSEFGVHHRQGVASRTLWFSFSASYMLRHNVFFEIEYINRERTAAFSEQFIMAGIRWNFDSANDEF